MSPVLVTAGLGKDYDETVALDDLSVSVDAGERVMVVGPNGSGKTTLLRITAGLLEATSGKATVAGAPPGSLPARAATSYIPDAPVLYDDLSVAEHLEYVGRLHGNEDWQDSAEELVERLGLEERVDDLPARFSRGLRQKTSIARAVLKRPDLLILNEATSALDGPAQSKVSEGLKEEVAGRGLIWVLHRASLARNFDRVLVLSNGKLEEQGSLSDLEGNGSLMSLLMAAE